MSMTEPIYALDLDEDLLSHLPDPEAWVVLQAEDVSAELIEDDFVAEVFAWQLAHLRQHARVATASVLEAQFDMSLEPPETSIGDLLDRLRLRYMKNQGRKRLQKIVETFHEDPLTAAPMFIREGRELQQIVGKRGEMFGTGDADRALHRYALKVQQGPGASFGHPELDDYFYGMRGLTIYLAPPKGYKSWQIIKGVVSNALQGKMSWLDSLELPTEETDMRLRCMLAGVPWYKYVHNKMTNQDLAAIRQASEYIDDSGIYRIVKPPQGKRGIDELVYTARDAGADVIFIDQLQYVENDKGESLGSLNNTGAYWGVLDKARNLSDDGPIAFAHQFNRSTMFADSMPAIEQAKGSSAIEETATLALGFWANKDMRRSGLLEVGTLITRNGMFASWEMQVDLTKGCDFTIIGRVEDDE